MPSYWHAPKYLKLRERFLYFYFRQYILFTQKSNDMSIKFIAGLALGAVIVHLLNTEEGKAFIGRFKSDVNKVEDEISGLAECVVQKGKELINGVQDRAEEEIAVPLIVVVESNPVF